jgi:hypothetical protein
MYGSEDGFAMTRKKRDEEREGGGEEEEEEREKGGSQIPLGIVSFGRLLYLIFHFLKGVYPPRIASPLSLRSSSQVHTSKS